MVSIFSAVHWMLVVSWIECGLILGQLASAHRIKQLVCGLQGPARWDAECAKAWTGTAIFMHLDSRKSMMWGPAALLCSPEAIAASVELSRLHRGRIIAKAYTI